MEKYEEALERARDIYNGNPSSATAKVVCEQIFPEFKESEDERIRKWIKKELEDKYVVEGIVNNIIADKAFGWLEKQKHLYETTKDRFYCEGFKEGRLYEKRKEQKTPSTEETELNSIAFLEQMGYTCIPPGKEQKPVEWSEDWREEDLRTRFAFYTYKDEDGVLYLSNVFIEETSRNKGLGTKILAAAEKVAETIGAITIRLKVKQNSPANAWYRKHGYGYMAFEGDYDWLEKTLEYLKPVKPKWSEEDKVMLNNIVWGIHMKSIQPLDEMDDRSKYEKYEDFLKSLPTRFSLQPKEKWGEEDSIHLNNAILSAEKEWGNESCTAKWLKSLPERFNPQLKQEWSEEDKEMLKSILFVLESYVSQSESESSPSLITTYPTYYKEIDWLKSLRPQSKQNMSIGFMIYLDEHRPEEKMCLSNAECKQIETAFKNQDWNTIIKYIEKYRSHWKPSEEQINSLQEVIILLLNLRRNVGDRKNLELLYEQLKDLM